jgi:uncharacterized repeat protein (TIGR01451 family)
MKLRFAAARRPCFLPWTGRARVGGTLLAGAIAVPVAVLPGAGPGAATPSPVSVRVHGLPTHADLPAWAGLSISVTDGRSTATTGDELNYLVNVQNSGSHAVSDLAVTQTLSQGLELLSASDQGAATAGRITWHVSIPADGTRSFHVDARVTRTSPRLLRLAAVACAEPAGSTRPAVCAAHLDALPGAADAATPAVGGFPGYAMAGLALLFTTALTLATWRWRRKRNA